jgi:DNA-binding helix-hairpin-helix protein with protein kinase domain
MTEKNIDAAYKHLAVSFQILHQHGFTVAEVNGLAMGMCRRSLVEAVGQEEAERLDREARLKMGWKS